MPPVPRSSSRPSTSTRSAIPALVEAGATLLGENRADALGAKRAAVAAGSAVRWDYIGELQSRKAAAIAAQVSRIHTLASASAARKLVARGRGRRTDARASDPGQRRRRGRQGRRRCRPSSPELLDAAADLPVRGLMTMPPLADRADDSRRWFAALRELAAEHGLAAALDGHESGRRDRGRARARRWCGSAALLTSDDAWQAPGRRARLRRGQADVGRARPAQRRVQRGGRGRTFRLGPVMSKSMAFRDRFQQTLVYFGLAEEQVDRYDAYAEPRPTKPTTARAARQPSRRRRARRGRGDDYEEIFADDDADAPARPPDCARSPIRAASATCACTWSCPRASTTPSRWPTATRTARRSF